MPAPARRATNVTLDPELVAAARALRLNLSRVLEQGLREAVRAELRRRWLEENEAAFSAYARFTERHDLFNEAERGW